MSKRSIVIEKAKSVSLVPVYTPPPRKIAKLALDFELSTKRANKFNTGPIAPVYSRFQESIVSEHTGRLHRNLNETSATESNGNVTATQCDLTMRPKRIPKRSPIKPRTKYISEREDYFNTHKISDILQMKESNLSSQNEVKSCQLKLNDMQTRLYDCEAQILKTNASISQLEDQLVGNKRAIESHHLLNSKDMKSEYQKSLDIVSQINEICTHTDKQVISPIDFDVSELPLNRTSYKLADFTEIHVGHEANCAVLELYDKTVNEKLNEYIERLENILGLASGDDFAHLDNIKRLKMLLQSVRGSN
ncbi:hypothetical protein DASB73_029780 [Starmerella bacillaris]|uniref:Uncharacterized protein n=1 Tax=Starmerella bacillaris TaxID=1247836 RepID=A0AAV5RKE7_STABA|nr:hypothetical protein DASB73_029780 [Starmerella bacillaris]